MTEYRMIKTKVWHDDWFLSLTPEEKCVWFFLHTNEYVHASGIYELPKPLISPLTGASESLKILAKFEQDGKIVYKNGFIFLKNFLRHQAKQFNKADNIYKSISSYFRENKYLVEWFSLQNEAPYKPLISPLVAPPLKGKREKVKGKREKLTVESADSTSISFSKKGKKENVKTSEL